MTKIKLYLTKKEKQSHKINDNKNYFLNYKSPLCGTIGKTEAKPKNEHIIYAGLCNNNIGTKCGGCEAGTGCDYSLK